MVFISFQWKNPVSMHVVHAGLGSGFKVFIFFRLFLNIISLIASFFFHFDDFPKREVKFIKKRRYIGMTSQMLYYARQLQNSFHSVWSFDFKNRESFFLLGNAFRFHNNSISNAFST